MKRLGIVHYSPERDHNCSECGKHLLFIHYIAEHENMPQANWIEVGIECARKYPKACLRGRFDWKDSDLRQIAKNEYLASILQ